MAQRFPNNITMKFKHNELTRKVKAGDDDPASNKHLKSLKIFCVDMTRWSWLAQFVTLSCGLFLFSCAYGYFQELVVYSWFQRKLSLFSSFLHFFGCSICALIQKYLTSGTSPVVRRASWRYHAFLSILKVATQVLTNLSMVEINYPAKVMFKSALPIVTMIIGFFCFKKKYCFRDYIVVLLLVLGLCIFLR